jgi:hypothetical protein
MSQGHTSGHEPGLSLSFLNSDLLPGEDPQPNFITPRLWLPELIERSNIKPVDAIGFRNDVILSVPSPV